MKYRLFFLLLMGLLAGISLTITGQTTHNLVPNSSFEHYDELPEEMSQFYLARPWQTFAPGDAPADYFHRLTKSPQTSVPLNFIGHQHAYHGDAYAGILVYLNSPAEYTEFIQVKLTAPLVKDSLYYAEMYVSLADDSRFAADGLDMLISTKAPLLLQGGFTMYKPQVRNPARNILADRDNWVKISGTFKASGGEQLLTIGNFRLRKNTNIRKLKAWRKKKEPYKYAYYYIDAVTVAPVYPPKEAPAKPYFGKMEKNQPVVLKNIYFETDKARLLPASYPELDQLLRVLKEKPALKIVVMGHTDNTNTNEYNLKLSEWRALAVKTYLTENGIEPKRITTKAFGSTRPIADNKTEAGRQQNRRVEFEVVKE